MTSKIKKNKKKVRNCELRTFSEIEYIHTYILTLNKYRRVNDDDTSLLCIRYVYRLSMNNQDIHTYIIHHPCYYVLTCSSDKTPMI